MRHHRVGVRCTDEIYNPPTTYDKHLGVAKYSLDIFE
jgi:hypothetical protein